MTADESKKVRAFRTGVLRKTPRGMDFKAAMLIGLSADGGVFVAPYDSLGAWQYGVLDPDAAIGTTSAHTWMRPKLHYHRSGMVYATLSGQDLERRSLRLPPLTDLRRSQIFSVICVRPWELPSRPKGFARGDSATFVHRWPEVVTWTVFLMEASSDIRQPLIVPDFPSRGLLAGADYTHEVVSLSAYGREAVLLITVSIDDTWEDLPSTGGTTIAALPWHPGMPTGNDRSFGLWSARLRNPLLKWEISAPTDLTPVHTTSVKAVEDDFDRMADLAVPDGGFQLRPPARPQDDLRNTWYAGHSPTREASPPRGTRSMS